MGPALGQLAKTLPEALKDSNQPAIAHPPLPPSLLPLLTWQLTCPPEGDLLTCLSPSAPPRAPPQPAGSPVLLLLPGSAVPVLPLLLPSRSDTSPPPPCSQTQAPPHTPRWPPFQRKKEQTTQEIKFAFYLRAPSSSSTELPKVRQGGIHPPFSPFPLLGLKYPSFAEIREASGLFTPYPAPASSFPEAGA